MITEATSISNITVNTFKINGTGSIVLIMKLLANRLLHTNNLGINYHTTHFLSIAIINLWMINWHHSMMYMQLHSHTVNTSKK